MRLGWMLDHLHGLVAAHVFQHMATALHGDDMSFSQLNAIYRLYRNGSQTIAQIAAGADLSHTAASRMVDRLVQAGIVERNEDPANRRQKRVELTGAGVSRLSDLQALTAGSYAELLNQIPEPVLHRFGEVLEEVRSHLPVHPMLDSPRSDEAVREPAPTQNHQED